MLKEDPNYIDKMLPRAVLFGVETNFLKVAQKILGDLYYPDRYSGDNFLSGIAIHSMSYQIYKIDSLNTTHNS